MADVTYKTIPDLTAAQDSQVTDSALLEMAVVDAGGTDGYSSRKVTKEQLLSDLKGDLGDLSELDTTVKTDLVSAINEVASGGSALTQDTKQALLQCFAHTAWSDAHGQDYYDDLEDALYPFDLLSSITAVYTQSGTVYDTDSLDDLKADLVVTGNYSDGTYNQTTKYTLSGTLTVGTSTITVTYGGKTATFTVTVSQSQAVLTSISAVYTQSGTVYDTDSLDSLKADLVVTAHYSDSSSSTVPSTDYTLSGTLTVGTSTITVTYEGETDTFSVTVTQAVTILYQLPEIAEVSLLNGALKISVEDIDRINVISSGANQGRSGYIHPDGTIDTSASGTTKWFDVHSGDTYTIKVKDIVYTDNTQAICYISTGFKNASGQTIIGSGNSTTIPVGSGTLADYEASGTISANDSIYSLIVYDHRPNSISFSVELYINGVRYV